MLKEVVCTSNNAMSDLASKNPKGYATDYDNEYGYTADENNVIDFNYKRKITNKNNGRTKKWQNKKK
jgi:hypothetical protein